ncbi:alpha-ketoglutarate-dependent dioxygenase alkB homolog 7, mitochondrial [Coccinella septempunctata]|uniref:alpha-ketoglutarate-dependent dioxygenase alkB homolog 7, mitochondrial n=1 Tax=Coccinella septempunctata TaxID=41139 RepID=UPI001D07B4DC|nr:alpha-ketoglutarate-dependent dioxygenase alkB homolog 7, mitochondrial [Coccinella septempunctata]
MLPFAVKHSYKPFKRFFSQILSEKQGDALKSYPPYIHFCDKLDDNSNSITQEILKSMKVYENFLSVNEEASLLQELEPYMKRLRYEYDHWDNAIHGYRETERLKWNDENTKILDRVRHLAFPSDTSPLKFVHILDLAENGYIKPHIDAIRFCGNTIAGLSLLTDSIMRLVNDNNKELYVDILLKRRSLYVMKDEARFKYTHEILDNPNSFFKGEKVCKTRRISVICRNEPNKETNL